MNIRKRLIIFWFRWATWLVTLAWSFAVVMWLRVYTNEIGSNPFLFGVYAAIGSILLLAYLFIAAKPNQYESAATSFLIWKLANPKEFEKLQQEYQDGEFQVFHEEIEKILKPSNRAKP